MAKKIKGWPDTDPYPFRNLGKPLGEDEDCDFVKRDKEYAKTAEIDDYAYIMAAAWKEMNYLSRKLREAEARIKWLNNVGGENLNLACGFDIFFRDRILEKREIAKKVEDENG